MTRAAWLLVGILGMGCTEVDDDPTVLDPIKPAGLTDPTSCDAQFGTTFVIESMGILPGDQGFDLDGDGVLDNSLAFLAPAANYGWIQSIAIGTAIYLFDLLPSIESLGDMPARPGLTFYEGVDSDADPGNNVSGDASFFVSAEQFDVNCDPLDNQFHDATADGATLHATSPHWAFFMDGVGTLEFEDVQLTVDFAGDMSTFVGTLGAVWTVCSLSRSPFPGETSGTFLDQMANSYHVAPDIDRDGDGIEQIIGNGDTVDSCIDGDGTVISGPFCACDPRMADGYSVALRGNAVRASIIGVVETQP